MANSTMNEASMPYSLKDKVAIVGIGRTAYAKGLPDSELSLAGQAIKAALDDAGIEPAAVDGMTASTYMHLDEEEIVRDLGLGDQTFFARSPHGGGGACGTIGFAAMAIATGQASVVVAVHSRKRTGKSTRPWGGA